MSEQQRKKYDNDRKGKPFKRRPPRREKVIIGETDFLRREKLLANAEYGLGKVEQRGKNLHYTVGNDDFGYVEYLIINASITTVKLVLGEPVEKTNKKSE
jgi:hypothetical protein